MISEIDGQLHIAGEMNHQTATALLAEGTPLVGGTDQVLNLAAVTVVDSSALAVLLEWARTARAAGRQLRVVDAPAALVSLASLYGVSEILFPSAAGNEHSVQH